MFKITLITILITLPSIAFGRYYDYYYSPNMLFSVRIPKNLKFCRENPAAPNDDVGILIDSKDCRHSKRHSEIAVGGSWYEPDPPHIRGARAYAEDWCAKETVTMADFDIAGLPLYGCEVSRKDGFFEIQYYAERRLKGDDRYMYLFIVLRCKKAIHDKCMADLYKVARAITLNTD